VELDLTRACGGRRIPAYIRVTTCLLDINMLGKQVTRDESRFPMVWGRGIASVGCRKYLDTMYRCSLGRIEEEVGLKDILQVCE